MQCQTLQHNLYLLQEQIEHVILLSKSHGRLSHRDKHKKEMTLYAAVTVKQAMISTKQWPLAANNKKKKKVQACQGSYEEI